MSKPKQYTSKKGNKYLIRGGVYTGYSCLNMKTNKSSIYGFDNTEEVRNYIDKAESWGKKKTGIEAMGYKYDLEGVIEGQW
jgi:hypothetical protein